MAKFDVTWQKLVQEEVALRARERRKHRERTGGRGTSHSVLRSPPTREELRLRLKSKMVENDNGCWIWKGTSFYLRGGYGEYSFGHERKVHRLMWVLANERIPAGMHILHKCDNPPCCNPDHLFIGTQADNMADKTNKGRGFKKLSVQDVLDIRKYHSANRNPRRPHEARQGVNQFLADKYGVATTTISSIAIGLLRKNVAGVLITQP